MTCMNQVKELKEELKTELDIFKRVWAAEKPAEDIRKPFNSSCDTVLGARLSAMHQGPSSRLALWGHSVGTSLRLRFPSQVQLP